ncbi:MAG: DNA-3-methyladenine glycosylase I [Gammaproteobacteria bacterium]
MDKKRCTWCMGDPLYIAYHDTEWGVPIYDDRLLFEFLILEGMQAGLSWFTVLKKRPAFRAAFSNFAAEKIVKYDQRKINSLLNDAGIIRNKLKIAATIQNAKAFLAIQEESGSFSNYIWHFVNDRPIQNNQNNSHPLPSQTIISETMSKELKKKGFNFVGSTICYAYMQAVGMVNDHVIDCYRHKELVSTGFK